MATVCYYMQVDMLSGLKYMDFYVKFDATNGEKPNEKRTRSSAFWRFTDS